MHSKRCWAARSELFIAGVKREVVNALFPANWWVKLTG
jgi:hypothetical protein